MRKILSATLLFVAALGFTACSGEEDDLFDMSAAERLNAAKDLYSSRLMAQPNGWAMQFYPTYDNEAPNGKGYLLLTRFNKDFTADVCGYIWPYWSEDQVGQAGSSETEWRVHYLNLYRETTAFWEIITDNGPVLSFNTYNDNMHYFSDPDYRSSDSEHGTGFGGDYEFIVVEAPDDASYMMLKGKKRGTYNLLTPIEEGIVYEDYMADVTNFQNYLFPTNAPTFNVVHFGDSIYKMIGAEEGLPNIYPYDGDPIANESFNPFLITKRGDNYYLRFRDAREFPDNVTVQDFLYNTEKDVLESVDYPDYFIGGDTVARFLNEALYANRQWQINSRSEMSASMKETYTAMSDQMRAGKYTLSNVAIILDPNGVPSISIRYTANRTNANMYYKVNIVREGNDLVVNLGEVSDGGRVLLQKFPAIETFMNTLCRRLTGAAATTQFNLNTIKLISADNADDWYVFTLR